MSEPDELTALRDVAKRLTANLEAVQARLTPAGAALRSAAANIERARIWVEKAIQLPHVDAALAEAVEDIRIAASAMGVAPPRVMLPPRSDASGECSRTGEPHIWGPAGRCVRCYAYRKL